ERVIVTGSLKYDTAQITDKVDSADALAAQLKIYCHCEPERSEGVAISKLTDEIASVASLPRNDVVEAQKLWVAGATGPGEEKIILDVFKKLIQVQQFNDLRLAVVPRKPERFDEVARLIEQSGFNLIRYSNLKTAKSNTIEQSKIENRKLKIDAVILGDTMGDLRKFYSLATIIFVGRSLVPMGGSDMMEAAALGKCTIFGPHAFNFRQTVDALLKDNGAIMVKDKQELLQTMQKCLRDPDFASAIAKNGQEVIRKHQGATTKSIEQIAKFLS
ncbi:MAG: 3-deoxy-D-manno-octulosonic acid transferase, partial [Sedimentisphaerales bacterium]